MQRREECEADEFQNMDQVSAEWKIPEQISARPGLFQCLGSKQGSGDICVKLEVTSPQAAGGKGGGGREPGHNCVRGNQW